MVVSGKPSKSKGDDAYGMLANHWHPVLCQPGMAGSWDEGHLVRIFSDGSLVSYFIVSKRFAMGCGGGGSKRKFNELSQGDLEGLL
eukprot:525271-Rhodomonas_salina.1